LDDVQVFGSRKQKGLYKCTRYYGQRNKHGFCKIYDKGKEQKLQSNLTRIEHTLSGRLPLSLESFYIRSSGCSDLSGLSGVLKTIVMLCLEVKQFGGEYSSILDNLDGRTKKKVLEHLDGSYVEYVYDHSILDSLLQKISETFYLCTYVTADGFMALCDDDDLPFS
jgi:hypothetical protein